MDISAKIKTFGFVAVAAVGLFVVEVVGVSAASFSVGPTNGTFTIDSTFEANLLINTEGETVNAIHAVVSFPPDKLQLVAPATSNSIIQLWTAPPQFNNQTGRIELQGGIPGGIKLSSGLVMKLTFRVKSVGTAVVRYLDESQVLLHDGKGTDVLQETSNAIYTLVLPPPGGPVVTSETHPDQTRWYPSAGVVLTWAPGEPVSQYSYILNDRPVDIPDDIGDSSKTTISYTAVKDGVRYFHIKGLRDATWGGTTHFAIKVDTAPPAQFPIEVIPAARTVRRQPILQFTTTDAHSGFDHFEVKLVSLQPPTTPADRADDQPFFLEAQSPYILPELDLGRYDAIVRAYDRAGNLREGTAHLEIVSSLFRFVGPDGLELRQHVVIPWRWLWIILLLVVLLMVVVAWRVRRWHHTVYVRRQARTLPGHLAQRLDELKRLRAKYGSRALLVLLLVWGTAGASQAAMAQPIVVTPPVVTTVTSDISNQEIYYVGGMTQHPLTPVVIYLQNLQTGETTSEEVISDDQYEWFYRHHTFLPAGKYLLWVQSRLNEQLSPPSAQLRLTVQATAIQLGASRISHETLYLGFTLVLLAAFLGALGYIIFHGVHARRKHQLLVREVHEAEEAVRRGFAVLRRDLEAELAVIHRARLNKALSVEEHKREAQLRADFTAVEKYVGKELWDVEHAEYTS